MGTLVYVPGIDTAAEVLLDWLTRDGKTTPLNIRAGAWGGVRSPRSAAARLHAYGRGERGHVDRR